MDFYFDIGMAVILRIVGDRKSIGKYYAALAKLYMRLDELRKLDTRFNDVVVAKSKEKGLL